MRIKSGAHLFIARFRIAVQRLIRRCPRRLRVLVGPLLGGFIGIIMGAVPGLLIGLLLGYLLRELFIQFGQDRKILDYFENPGFQQFYEAEPGLAAWCALGILIAQEASLEISGKIPPETSNTSPTDLSVSSAGEKTLNEVILGASRVFGFRADPSLIEHFSRLALSNWNSLNPDLLAESLAARRVSSPAYTAASETQTTGVLQGSREDLRNLGRGLRSLATGEKARMLARQICLILDPAMEDEKEPEPSGSENKKDPWKILGLPPGTPLKEVKIHYRRLAKQFHPDELISLDEKHRETAASAFVAIKEAYREVSKT